MAERNETFRLLKQLAVESGIPQEAIHLGGGPVAGAAHKPPHQVHLRDAQGTSHLAAVNVKSQQAPSGLLYLANDDFAHPLLGLLPDDAAGWTLLPSTPGGPNLDFIRGNLFDPADMETLGCIYKSVGR